jgi:hypothetical protein
VKVYTYINIPPSQHINPSHHPLICPHGFPTKASMDETEDASPRIETKRARTGSCRLFSADISPNSSFENETNQRSQTADDADDVRFDVVMFAPYNPDGSILEVDGGQNRRDE